MVASSRVWRVPARGCNRHEVAAPTLGRASIISTRPQEFEDGGYCGDRQANSALHMVVVSRMRTDERTKAYVARRLREGLSKKEIIRCLKRYVAHEVFRTLVKPAP